MVEEIPATYLGRKVNGHKCTDKKCVTNTHPWKIVYCGWGRGKVGSIVFGVRKTGKQADFRARQVKRAGYDCWVLHDPHDDF